FFSWRGLVEINSDDVTWDGIDVIRSNGDGIQIGDDKDTYDTITVKNCTVSRCRRKNINVQGKGKVNLW
ncbi:MAG: hypothetical protein GWN00_15590, partial [Aliifodinibius sp.]|nr:hypothetical protein [Fodinibius sp.]NIV12486.1 hypothetical protein [Fodinibius sp.]NIY26174.1 hypothetical protein [Fodinibius sp.]